MIILLVFTQWDGIDYDSSCILKNSDSSLLTNGHFVIYLGIPFPAAQRMTAVLLLFFCV